MFVISFGRFFHLLHTFRLELRTILVLCNFFRCKLRKFLVFWNSFRFLVQENLSLKEFMIFSNLSVSTSGTGLSMEDLWVLHINVLCLAAGTSSGMTMMAHSSMNALHFIVA